MNKIRLSALVMCFAILMSMLTSCRLPGSNGNNVVKADDPWYESTRFKIEKNLRQNDRVQSELICTSDDVFYSIYCSTDDMYASTRTILDTYDYDGKLVNRKELTCTECDGFNIMDIYGVNPNPDGKSLNAAIWLNSTGKRGLSFVDIDIETGLVSNIREMLNKRDEKIIKKDYGFFYLYLFGDYAVGVYNGSGAQITYQLILFKNSELVCELDLSTVELLYLLDGFTVDESRGSLFMTGYVKQDIITMEFDLNSGKLKSKNGFRDIDDNTVNIGEYQATDDGMLCKIDSLGNIMKVDINSMTTQTVVDTNWYNPLFAAYESEGYYNQTKVLNCNENRVVIWDSESTTYCSDTTVVENYIRVLKKCEKNPNAGKKVIELALPPDSTVSAYLSKSIYEFNRTDNEYLIRIWDKYKTGFAIGRRAYSTADESEQEIYKMIQDLKSDQAPDLAIGVQKNYAMRDDVLMDLNDFLDPSVMEKMFMNIVEAGKIDGKLYFIPVTLHIEGLVTNTELIKDGAVGITFDEYDKLIKDQMHGFSPYDYPESSYCNKHSFLMSCIDTKSSIEGDKIDFGTAQFRAAAEYAKNNFQYDDMESIPSEYVYDWNRYRGKCYYTILSDYLGYVHSCYTAKDNYSIIGTPSVDASGPRFFANETISVTANTDMKEGCKKFINYLFSGEAFNSDACAFRQIVINKDIMKKNIDTLTEINNKGYEKYRASVQSGVFRPASGYDKAFGDKFATDQMRESFLNSLSTISIYFYEDYSIVKFIDEELAPYYAGDRTLDDAIKFINDRTTKYVREM